ncbi:uncharacterized protein LOC130648435 [Hydractinia symbiolongicarpus]|uniref:uncharacterized protein LOC130648435 n=1 Tax=Hydractinia symbiolongicarpus TaxID=13093 RepID=UPI00254E4FD1|nr:uncharacterized protein LOC130648435 [Hydractinia symbiolongicarpus]
MTPHQYEILLSKVAPRIIKVSKREPIGPSERLCVTLRYLATGDAQTTIATNFRMSPTTVCRIIEEATAEIWNSLVENYVAIPKVEEWKRIAYDFGRGWNFPNCIGALDGKHVVIQAPANTGSMYFNYKKTFSIVLMSVCDANYSFTLVDIGDIGRNSDSGVGDEAFPLRENLMKPFPKESLGRKERIYNYRLSRARRTIENTFGICASRFRIFTRLINARVHVAVNITKAVVALHNYLMAERCFQSSNYCPPGYADTQNRPGDWRQAIGQIDALQPIQRAGSNNYSKNAKKIREQFRDYFVLPEGQVNWQWDMIPRT